MNSYSRVRVGVVGATGYSGVELLRRLAQHPHVAVRAAMGSGASEAKRIAALKRIWDAPIELVAIRAIGIGRTTRAQLAPLHPETVPPGTPAAVARHRSVRVERGEGGRRDIPVYDRDAMRLGHALVGPALIDAADTTIWVPAGMNALVNPQGTLVMECQTAAAQRGLAEELEPIP